MANLNRNFIAGKMNKSLDERLVPNGEYIDAMNIRLGSTERSEMGSVENSKGNIPLTTLQYIDNTPLSSDARCIGAYADSARETIYWFVHDPSFPVGATGKLDLVVSFNVKTNVLTYHVVSIDDGGGVNTTLNFNKTYTITGVNLVEDLLFWTDDYNEPRFINITRSYPVPILNVDNAILGESLLVVKRPPAESPAVQIITTGGEDNYMEDRMVCFAYRYRYSDNDYSATSQWSQPAFAPKAFEFGYDSFLNEGMINRANAAIVTFYSGGPLVKGVDVLFKFADGNVIQVIEKIDKAEAGYIDNTAYSLTFDNSKIFTVLQEAELLRLYDNVPLKAKAQTVMGNRLMYGNYVEGRDLVDANGNDTRLEYFVDLISEDIGLTDIPESTEDGQYTIGGHANTIPNSRIDIDLAGVNLIEGASITIEITINHDSFDGNTPFPTQTTQNIYMVFTYILPQAFSSVHQMATSQDFLDAVGTIANIEPVPTACNGATFTDIFNCSIPQNLGTLTKVDSGIDVPNEPIRITSSIGSDIIGLQLPAVLFVDNVITPTQFVYEYYQITNGEAFYQEIDSPKSLHSNRGYEIGIVYMDGYNRATTALVSPNNTVHVPCSLSDRKNSIRVTIPISQVAPAWAKSYKFVIKPDEQDYETIYTPIFFQDPDTNYVYFLLDGENAAKVIEGQRLIVKRDTSGVPQDCSYATVLEKESQPSGFLQIPSDSDPSVNIDVPAGAYMKILPTDFSAVQGQNSYISEGKKTEYSDDEDTFPELLYPVHLKVGSNFINYDIPAGSIIKMEFKFTRLGVGQGNGACERREYTLIKQFVSRYDYPDFKAWWDGDNIQAYLNDGTQSVGLGGCPIGNTYNPVLSTSIPAITNYDLCFNRFQFYQFTAMPPPPPGFDYPLYLAISGTKSCKGWFAKQKRRSTVEANIEVFRADSLVVFETEPTAALPDVFYESEQSFGINANGEHAGNVQNQDFSLAQPAVINTSFFNCFSFGNGVESYKVRDSIGGRFFGLGNRGTSTSEQDYREIRRFADITYSGIYNNETNVNRLNEFNLGLANFKNCEISYGAIQILDARMTDVLVLQEDRIGYVMAGKNLLSDSAGGGNVASVLEVLGTQIARPESYGISNNPESYTRWGYDKFFTDAKRGSVIQLRGDSYSNEQLAVISNMGMHSWFRDLFIDDFSTQKLGGYDPYMDEYVLSSNNELTPEEVECLSCGVERTLSLLPRQATEYCVNLGNTIGEVTIYYTILSIEPEVSIAIDANYDGSDFTSGVVSTSGFFSFTKGANVPEDVIITAIGGPAVVEILVDCPVATPLTIVEVCITAQEDAGKFIHNEHRWNQGTYYAPLQSAQVTFLSGPAPIVSRYQTFSGAQGTGIFPVNGANVKMISNKIGFDNFFFNPATDKFLYLRTNTFYNNTPVDINALLAAAIPATPIIGSLPTYYADFTMPGGTDTYLYLIWMYRPSVEVELCYDEFNDYAVCCLCTDGNNLLVQECYAGEVVPMQIVVTNPFAAVVGDFVEISVGGIHQEGCVWEVIGETTEAAIGAVVTIRADITNCDQVCAVYRLSSSNLEGGVFGDYYDCEGNTISYSIFPTFGEPPNPGFIDICATGWPSLPIGVTAVKFGCVCPDNLLVERCGDGFQEVIPAGTALIGQFITLTGYSTDCVWEVVTYTAQEPTDTIATLTAFESCDQVCKTYSYLALGPEASVSYIDCNGDPQTINPPSETGGTFCALYIVSTTPTITVNPAFPSPCGCNENLLVRQCRLDGAIVNEVIPAGFASIGEFIQNTDAGCTYEVIGYSTSAVTIPAPVLAPFSSCDEACDTYTLTNNGAIVIGVSYIDCEGVPQVTDNVPTGGSVLICAKQVDVPPDFTIAFAGCGCGE